MIKAGAHIDNYQVISMLGTGSFGYVYKAWHKGLDRPVAIKLMNRTVMEETDGVARFEREAIAMNKLTHRNIVAFHGFGIWEGAPYMVMEFVEGTPLSSLLAEKQPLAQSRAIDLAYQLCDALYAAHNVGIVHRDLKPSNMMLTELDGRECLKIIDFGLAKLMPGYGVAAQKLTETGMAVGTCHYMSPEQCVGNSQVDHRTDIYAAGCILHEMLTGMPPFVAEDSVAVMFQHVNAPPPRLSDIVPTDAQTHGLQAVIDKAMAKEPEARYQSANEMSHDLHAIAIGNTRAHDLAKVAMATRPKWKYNPNKPELKKLVPGVLALAIVSAVGIYALTTHQSNEGIGDTAPELASTVYDEVSRELARNGHAENPEQRRHMLTLMQKAIELNKRDHSLTRAQEYQMLHGQELSCFAFGRADLAIGLCQQAIPLAPTNADRIEDEEHLARAYELTGQDANADEMLTQLAAQTIYSGAERKKLNIALARIKLKRGDEAAARKYISQVPDVNLPGSSAGIYYEVAANIAFLDGNYKAARSRYEQGINASGLAEEPIFQAGIARCALMMKQKDDYLRLQSVLDGLWHRIDGKTYQSVGLLEAMLAIELKDQQALTSVCDQLLKGGSYANEIPSLSDWDRKHFSQSMQKAGYNQLLEKIANKYGWT